MMHPQSQQTPRICGIPLFGLFLATALLLANLAAALNTVNQAVNTRPIVGILTLPVDEELKKYGTHEIPASYVKFLEGAGLRIAPVPHDTTDVEWWFKRLNGLLFTGGGLSLTPKTPYFETAKAFYQKSVESFKKGDVFPLWGTCEGFQLLCILAGGEDVLKGGYDSENLPLALNMTDYDSRILGKGTTPAYVLHALTTRPMTINLHHFGVPTDLFQSNHGLKSTFRLISTNFDRKQQSFGSTMEGTELPFYATQWHPERNQFEWDATELDDHSVDAIQAVQWLADYFGQECRRSSHVFEDSLEYLIYNHCPIYTGNSTHQEHADRQTYVY